MQVNLPLIFNSYTRTCCSECEIKRTPEAASSVGLARSSFSKTDSLGNHKDDLLLPS